MKKNKSKDDTPVMRSLSIVRQAPGWVVVTLETQGGVIISETRTEPDTRMICIETFKKLAVTEFML